MFNIDDLLINMQLYHAAMVFEALLFPSTHIYVYMYTCINNRNQLKSVAT